MSVRLSKILLPACFVKWIFLNTLCPVTVMHATALDVPSGQARVFRDIPVPKLLRDAQGARKITFPCEQAVGNDFRRSDSSALNSLPI